MKTNMLKSSETSYNISLNTRSLDFLKPNPQYLENFNISHLLSLKVDTFDRVVEEVRFKFVKKIQISLS